MQLKQKEFEKVFELIPYISEFHNTNSKFYKLFDEIIKNYFNSIDNEILEAYPFNNLLWPKVSLGNIDSYGYFTFSEMVHYCYYWNNRDTYKVVFDIGANIGIDTLILAKFGFDVYSFEPDPEVFSTMQYNIDLNKCKDINLYCKGLSDKEDSLDFVRVKGNTASSHIAGEKEFYGEIDRFKIETVTFQSIGVIPDLMKINIEGHEKTLIPTISKDIWEVCDAFIELHGLDCCEVAFDYFNSININIFSQKIGWRKVSSLEEMPLSYREGTIFVSSKDKMNWK